MERGAARVGDKDAGAGVCAAHLPVPEPYTTTFLTGATNVSINGKLAAIVTSIGEATCGHITTAMTGSPTVFFNNQPAHRCGDTGANFGQYTVNICSDNVQIG